MLPNFVKCNPQTFGATATNQVMSSQSWKLDTYTRYWSATPDYINTTQTHLPLLVMTSSNSSNRMMIVHYWSNFSWTNASKSSYRRINLTLTGLWHTSSLWPGNRVGRKSHYKEKRTLTITLWTQFRNISSSNCPPAIQSIWNFLSILCCNQWLIYY